MLSLPRTRLLASSLRLIQAGPVSSSRFPLVQQRFLSDDNKSLVPEQKGLPAELVHRLRSPGAIEEFMTAFRAETTKTVKEAVREAKKEQDEQIENAKKALTENFTNKTMKLEEHSNKLQVKMTERLREIENANSEAGEKLNAAKNEMQREFNNFKGMSAAQLEEAKTQLGLSIELAKGNLRSDLMEHEKNFRRFKEEVATKDDLAKDLGRATQACAKEQVSRIEEAKQAMRGDLKSHAEALRIHTDDLKNFKVKTTNDLDMAREQVSMRIEEAKQAMREDLKSHAEALRAHFDDFKYFKENLDRARDQIVHHVAEEAEKLKAFKYQVWTSMAGVAVASIGFSFFNDGPTKQDSEKLEALVKEGEKAMESLKETIKAAQRDAEELAKSNAEKHKEQPQATPQGNKGILEGQAILAKQEIVTTVLVYGAMVSAAIAVRILWG